MYAAENKAQDLGLCAGPRGPRCYASVRLPRSTMGRVASNAIKMWRDSSWLRDLGCDAHDRGLAVYIEK